jgi:hypothetical protein
MCRCHRMSIIVLQFNAKISYHCKALDLINAKIDQIDKRVSKIGNNKKIVENTDHSAPNTAKVHTYPTHQSQFPSLNKLD